MDQSRNYKMLKYSTKKSLVSDLKSKDQYSLPGCSCMKCLKQTVTCSLWFISIPDNPRFWPDGHQPLIWGMVCPPRCSNQYSWPPSRGPPEWSWESLSPAATPTVQQARVETCRKRVCMGEDLWQRAIHVYFILQHFYILCPFWQTRLWSRWLQASISQKCCCQLDFISHEKVPDSLSLSLLSVTFTI